MVSIHETVIIPAPHSRVWAAWTEPELLSQWYPDRVEGRMVSGQSVRFIWDCFGMSLELEVMEMWPPYRLRLRAQGPEGQMQEQLVTLAGYGSRTRVDVVHSGFTPTARGQERMAGTQAGWHTMLRVLKLYVQEYFGQPRQTHAALGPVIAPLEQIFAYYTDGAYLDRWLACRATKLDGEGKLFAMPLNAGQIVAGRVLSYVAPRELALDLPDFRTVISMRAFPLSDQSRLVGAWLSGWSPDEDFRSLQAAVTDAVARLVAVLGGPAAAC